MTNLESKLYEYKELKRMIEEMQNMADSIADEVKKAMDEAEQESMIIGAFKVSHKLCVRKDIDKKKLEAEHKALYDAYLKQTTYKRFLVS